MQILEPPHASVEAVVDVLMKVDLSAAGIDALETAVRTGKRPAAPPQGAQLQPFPGQQPQLNGGHPVQQPGMTQGPPQQGPPFGGIHPGQNQPNSGRAPLLKSL